jgi:threonine dehydrogenase-like Zn-dependent dehydrogenase
MRAAILRDGAMVVDDIPDLVPGKGQVLVDVVACGICGSDLHTVDHAHDLVASAEAAGVPLFTSGFDPDQDMVMGHEISVRVVGIGDGVDGITEGETFAAMPVLEGPDGRIVPGYNNRYPGGYSEQMLLSPSGLLPIPNGLDPALAALTEPMAVGLHAVNESSVEVGRAAVVVGAGPVGLAVTAALSASGVEPIIVADFSPTRRRVAAQMGAHVVVDPSEASVFDAWRDATDGVDPPVVFEAVGVPGMIDRVMADAPVRSEIIVVGVCIPPDSFRPSLGIYKHLSLKFVLGWTPEEFASSLRNLAEGRIDGATLVTGEVNVEGVPQAFADLADPEEHVKILVRPGRG